MEKAIVWAIDPFEKETTPDPYLVRKLMDWARSSNLELQPVHILPLPKHEPDSFFESGGLVRAIAAAEYASARYLLDLGVTGVRATKVLLVGSASRKENVQDLLKFAEERQSPWIVVSSHARSGVQRLVLGSFAENLLLQSTVPVLFLTHLANANEGETQIKRVLFATDFSDRSRETFRRFLTQMKRFRFDLTLFHSVSLPVSVLTASDGAPLIIPEDYLSKQETWAKQEGAHLMKLTQSQGISARLIIKNEGIGPNIGESILETAREERAGMIAMASSSGALTSLVAGSVARDVFRANRYPVWVYGPKALEMRHITEQSVSA